MNIVFLGTGTSHGIPMIGCDCIVCKSEDPRDNRTRSSAYIEVDGVSILIDTTPELRIQAVREGISSADAVLFTHGHADHIFGLDDVRRFCELSGSAMQCYGNSETLGIIRNAFGYAFRPYVPMSGGAPSLELNEVDSAFRVGGVEVIPIPVKHGRLDIFGYRIGDVAYVTDCSSIPDESRYLFEGLDLLILGVLRPQPHPTHFSLEQGLRVVDEFRPKRTLFTHLAHQMGHGRISAQLPDGVELAYDGLRVTI